MFNNTYNATATKTTNDYAPITRACIINTRYDLNTVCDVVGAMMIAKTLDGLTELISFSDINNEVVSTTYYLDGGVVGHVKAGEMWGPELSAIIDRYAD